MTQAFTMQNVCRLCLNEDAFLDIFKGSVGLLKKIEMCTNLQICLDDELPKTICTTCANFIESIVSFKDKCEQSDRCLRMRLELDQSIKHEIDQEDDPIAGHAFNYENPYIYPEITLTECKTNMATDVRPLLTNSKSDFSLKRFNAKKCEKRGRAKKVKKPERPCPFCGLELSGFSNWEKHLRSHKNKPFECDICKKNFRQKNGLIGHVKTHTDRKDYQCDICGGLFKNSLYIRHHVLMVHSDKTVKCKICGKLVKPYSIKNHIKTHDPYKKFECDICHGKFISKGSIIGHMWTHTGEKPFKCRFCDSSFTLSGTLRHHERLHTGETPYHCPECGKGFVQLSNMKSHFRNNHKGVEFVYQRKKRALKYNSVKS